MGVVPDHEASLSAAFGMLYSATNTGPASRCLPAVKGENTAQQPAELRRSSLSAIMRRQKGVYQADSKAKSSCNERGAVRL